MSQQLEEWLERMRKARNPGPAVRITTSRNHRDLGWIFDVADDTNLGELAERIDNGCREAGLSAVYELKAFDAEEHFIAPHAHKVQGTEIVPASPMPLSLPIGVEQSIDVSLRHNLAFAKLGLDSVVKSQRATERLMARYEEENQALRRENDQLRGKLADHWEVMHKLNTSEIEVKQEKDKIERMGRMGETFANALMARLFGRGATPEGQTVEHRMAMSLFRSLASDLGRVQQILPFLTDDERIAAMELMRPKDEPPTPDQLIKANGVTAAAAAAAVNGGRAA